MSSVAKAAVISAVAFVVILVATILFVKSGKNKVPREPEPKVAVETKAAPSAQKAPVGKEFSPESHIARDAVKLTVEVVEKARKKRLQGAFAMVLKSQDGERAGERVWESGQDTSGRWEVDLEPGAYQVRAQCPRYKGETHTITMIKDQPQSLVLELDRGNSISGRILAEGGAPIGGARVLALRELADPGADLEDILVSMIKIQDLTGEQAFAAETISAENGTYSLDGLDYKAYTVRATAAGFAKAEVEEIPAPRVDVDVIMKKSGIVGGLVRDTGGAPVGGATVKAYPEMETQDVFKIIINKARPAIDLAKADSAGRFQFKTLGPGLYNFLIEAKGYQRGEQTKVRVTPEAANLNFTIKPGVVLRGIVTGPTGEPVKDAKVRASATGSGAVARRDQVNISFDEDAVRTNEQGEFLVDTLDEGTYMVICFHPDYATARRNDVHVPLGNELNLKLSSGGRIKGLVTDATTGKPVAGAKLLASDVADFHKDAVTGEDGTYLLGGLTTTGSKGVSLTVTAEGFARARRDVTVSESREVDANFELQATGSVTGRVVNSKGAPIPSARVMVKKTQENSPVEQTLATDVSDREGKFVLTGIEAGENNWIRVKKGEYLDGVGEAFAVKPGESLEVEPIVLQLGGSLGGKVFSPTGEAVAGCMITVTNEGEAELNHGGMASAPTNARGEFLIQGLHTGKVDLVVKASHFVETRVDGVEVREGEIHQGIEIRLEQGNSVTGVIVDGRNQPVANAEVLAKDFAQGVKEIRTMSGTDGAFTVENIVGNDIIDLEVSHENYGAYSDPKVKVGSRDLRITLKALGSLKGIVVTPDGKPVDSFTVQAENPAVKDPRKKPKPQTFNPTDGLFEYRGVPGGVYSVHVRAPQYSATSIADVRVEEGEVVDLGQITLQVGGIVTGVVVDAQSGSPVSGARVQVAQGTSRFMKTDPAGQAAATANPIQTTGADGAFTFTGLKGGTMSLKVTHPDYVLRKIDDVNPDVSDKSQGLRVELEQGGEITGVVLDPQGKPRAAMSVYLIAGDTTQNQTTQTDRDGRFHFAGVASGSFTVKAHKFGGPQGAATEQADAAVELAPGEQKEVTLQLQ